MIVGLATNALISQHLRATFSRQDLGLVADARPERRLVLLAALLLTYDRLETHLIVHQLLVLAEECKVPVNIAKRLLIRDNEGAVGCHSTKLAPLR